MAFAERTPQEELLAQLPSEDQKLISSYAVNSLKHQEKSSSYNYSFSMKDHMKSFCSSVGIPLSVHTFKVHPHPFCKTLENFLLFDNLNYYKDLIDIYVSIKPEKVETLRRGVNMNFCKILNRVIADRDRLRYGNCGNNENFFSELHRNKQKTWFFHDELHHWDLETLEKFVTLAEPNRILATIVMPVEAFDVNNSLNPSFYEFEVHSRRKERGNHVIEMTFFPDGSRESGYYQCSSDFLFRYKRFNFTGQIYTVSFLRSIKSHHLILIEKGDLKTNKFYISDYSECLHAQMIGFSRVSRAAVNVRFNVFKKELIYLLSLKKADYHSAAAKLRQLSNDDYLPEEVAFFLSLANELDKNKGLFEKVSLFKLVQESLCKVFPKRLAENLSSGCSEAAFHNFILTSKPFQLKVKRLCYPEDINLLHDLSHEVDSCYILDEMEKKMYGLGPYSTGYSLDPFDIEGVTEMEWLKIKHLRVKKMEREMREEELKKDEPEFMEISVEELRFHSRGFRGSHNPGLKLRRKVEIDEGGKIAVLEMKRNSEKMLYLDCKPFVSNFSVIREVEMKDTPWFNDELDEGISLTEIEGEWENEPGEGLIPEEENETKEAKAGESEVNHKPDHEDEFIFKVNKDSLETSEAAREYIDGLFSVYKSKVYRHGGREALFFSNVKSGSVDYAFGGTKYTSIDDDEISTILREEGFNTCLIQRYEEGAGIGFHFDDEKCYDDDEIVTLNVIGEADMLLQRSNGAIEVIKLKPGSLIKFEPGSQRGENRYRHSVKNCTKGRISITLRHQKRLMNGLEIGEGPSKGVSRAIPENIGELFRGMKNLCFLDCLSEHLSVSREVALATAFSMDETILDKVMEDKGFSKAEIMACLSSMDIPFTIIDKGQIITRTEGSFNPITLQIEKDHVFVPMGQIKLKSQSAKIGQLLVEAGCNKVQSKPSVEKARRLCKAFQEGKVGVMLNKFKIAFNEIEPNHTNSTYICAGFAGSGKSRGLQGLIAGILNRKNVLVISPRKVLLEDWEQKLKRALNGRKAEVKLRTFESGIKSLVGIKGKSLKEAVIIVDECGLMPGGYLDLINCLSPPNSHIVFIFDPLQASFFDRKAVGEKLGDVYEMLYGSKFEYKSWSHRFGGLFKIEGVALLGKSEISPHHMRFFAQPEAVRAAVDKPIFLSPSEGKAEELSRYGESYTFGTAQGKTFDHVVISLDMDGSVTSDAAWMVALTRARRGFSFLTCASISKETFKSNNAQKLIGKVLNRQEISKKFWWNLGGRIMDSAYERTNLGKTREEMEDQLENDPWLKGILTMLEMPELVDDKPEEVIRKDSPPRTHLVVASDSMAFVEGASMVRAREFREFRGSNMWSEQFDDVKTRKFSENRAQTFESIYPAHKNSDTLTFWAAIKKRLKFSHPNAERRKLERLRDTGNNLFEIFRKEFNLRRGVKVSWDELNADFVEKRLNKSKALISAHAERSDPDWLVNHFFLFMKSQICTKFEKRFADAKAGQTLACFSHQVLGRFGVPIREAEAKLRAQLPDNIFIHSGKKLDELNEWCKKYATGFGTDSDYEAFDRSQDALILAFEIPLLKFLDWDTNLIEDYVAIKLRLGCRLGTLAIMRFTGEFGTFFLNTCCNMLFTCLRYKLDRGTPIAFAGDDMFSPRKLELRYDREFLLKRFSLKAKVNFSKEPMFCGWRMSKFGIVKEPKLVLERIEIAKEKGILKECLINYSLEVSFAYRLGERLYDVINNVEDQQRLVRFVVLNKHLLPPKVRKEFESYDHGFGGCESVQEKGECNRVHSFGCGLECNL